MCDLEQGTGTLRYVRQPSRKGVVDEAIIFDPILPPCGQDFCKPDMELNSLGDLISHTYVLKKDLLSSWGTDDWDD